ncbi:zinc-dependent metalloprotease [Puia sp.]|uniref:zinc-dependent metalloprotease n=1 Tax=Puia sp. TaxID=2045100 RepID=UPI002F40CC65
MTKNLLLLTAIAAVSTLPTLAQRPTTTTTTATTISAATQNMKKYEGFYNFYYDEKTGKLLIEIDRFDQEFLYFCSLPEGIGNGGAERGQASAVIAKFIKVGPKVFLLQPNYAQRAVNGNTDMQKDVADGFSQSILFGFSPVAVEGDKVLIDGTPLIVRDALHIGENIGSGRGNPGSAFSAAANGPGRAGAAAGGGYRLDETRSAVYMNNTKNFPKNTEFEALITFAGGSGGGGGFRRGGGVAPDPTSVTVRVHQAFVQLPDSNYKPRIFDPRSGFFEFTYADFSAPMSQPLVKRFISRHRLVKKDPSAAVSEPVEPIVYYIDRGAPPIILKALIEGASWWNQAFEAAGFKNAFQVKQLPEGADPMDIRYNMVNWLTRTGSPQRAFSYGSSYVDPRTGEIIKGVVTLGSDRHRQDYLIAEGLLQPYEDGKPVSNKMEELALARIRQLSAHEIGHTLGLSHNFIASIKDRASVMDYPFPRFTLKPDGTLDLSDAYAKGIGGWDKRAIMYGYSDFTKGTDEDAALNKIITETIKEGYKYIPDIGGMTHPQSNQWDDGVNAIDQLDKLMAVRRHLLDRFSEKAIPQGAPMATLEEVLVPIYLLHRYQVEAAAKSLGGLYFTHAVKNDGQEPTKMVDPAEQWRAFDALMNTITPDALALPDALIQKIPPRPSGYPSTVENFGGHTGPTFDPIAAAEAAANTTLSYLLDNERAARLIEYQARDERQPGLIPVLNKLLDKTWKTPLKPGYKGELQVLVDNLTLKHLLALAADPKNAENVRGEALLAITDLATWMGLQVVSGEPRWKAALYFGLSQINEFTKNPDKFIPQPAMEMPPGAPIGMPDDEFEF